MVTIPSWRQMQCVWRYGPPMLLDGPIGRREFVVADALRFGLYVDLLELALASLLLSALFDAIDRVRELHHRIGLPISGTTIHTPRKPAVTTAGDLRGAYHTSHHGVSFFEDSAVATRQRARDIPAAARAKHSVRQSPSPNVSLITLATSPTTISSLDLIVAFCQETGARVRIAPSLVAAASPRLPTGPLRDLNVSDLLMRHEVMLDVAVCSAYLSDRVVMVTGAAGSIGTELCRQLVWLQPRQLILLDINETDLFNLQAELCSLGSTCEVIARITDITDDARLNRIFERYAPRVVFHAAAYKHVPLLEDHAYEAVRTNVLGTANLCRAAAAHRVERFVFISSDKAAQAVNNLGYSKRIGELLVRAYGQDSDTIFCAVRFGNVIGSRGSVVPTFKRQIAVGGPVTVTHPDATRFFMTIPEAACLVIEAAASTVNGSLFMLDMGAPVSIMGLAIKMIRRHGLRVEDDVRIEFTGLRPGEKLHEVLTTEHEVVVPTAHAKIMRIVDDALVARGSLENMVHDLVTMALQADDGAVTQMLALAATAQVVPGALRIAATTDDERNHVACREDVADPLLFRSRLDGSTGAERQLQ